MGLDGAVEARGVPVEIRAGPECHRPTAGTGDQAAPTGRGGRGRHPRPEGARARCRWSRPAGERGPRSAARRTEVVWAEGADELVVDPAGVAVETATGAVRVSVPVSCDEARADTVRVTFAVGAPDRPAGLVAAAARRPEGPPVVVNRWGDALVAFAWSVLLGTVNGVAGATAIDRTGAPLVAAELVATPAGLTIVPQARHRFGGGAMTMTSDDLGVLENLAKAIGALDAAGRPDAGCSATLAGDSCACCWRTPSTNHSSPSSTRCSTTETSKRTAPTGRSCRSPGPRTRTSSWASSSHHRRPRSTSASRRVGHPGRRQPPGHRDPLRGVRLPHPAQRGAVVADPLLLGRPGGRIRLSSTVMLDEADPTPGAFHLGSIGISVDVPTAPSGDDPPLIGLTLGQLQLPGGRA